MNGKPLKIAFLLGKFPAISETFILNQITGLIDAGHEVHIFAKEQPPDAKIQTEVETYHLLERTWYFKRPATIPGRMLNTLRVLAKLALHYKPEVMRALHTRADWRQALSLQQVNLLYPLLDEGPFDILHCHFGSEGLAGSQLKMMGVPGKLIVTFHGYDISKFLNAHGAGIYRSVFDTADLLMPISNYWNARLIQLGADPRRIQVHRMGIDLNQFTFRQRQPRAPGEMRLVTVGRLVEKKGIRFALQAVARLHARHPDWQITYDIIGGGEQEDELRGLISQLGLQNCARLVGSKTSQEVQQYMLDSDIFLLPSITDSGGDQEGIPVSLMEAMATGMPIVSTLHTGIPELVEDGVSGYLTPEQDVDGLAARLEHLMSHPEIWPQMGLSGRRFVDLHHNIHRLNHQLIDTYQSLVYTSPQAVLQGSSATG